jgi:NAD+ kinase
VNLGLVVHTRRPEPPEFARRLYQVALSLGLKVVGDDTTAAILDHPVAAGNPDVIVALGGDGTVLAAAQVALQADLPVLAFNLGTIGFLAEAEPHQLEEVLTALARGEMTERRRMSITAGLSSGGTFTGINDVVVEKIHSQRLVSLSVAIDEAEFLTYRADGLVAATSTGSTAYNFSAGGPLMDPALEALLLTPVAPHSLFDRTMVLDPATRIGVTVATDRPVRVSVDGVECGTLAGGEWVEISRGNAPARFLTLNPMPFATTVKRKFRLG